MKEQIRTNAAQRANFSNIEVPAGATLIVDDLLEMAPGTYIIVRKGGTLIVNATITAGCGDMWGGVVVEGNGNFPQKETNGQPSSNQGRLVLNTDGVLEHAQTGIGVHGFENPDDTDEGGGIAEVFGRIRNCTKGIQFERYRNANTPNASTIGGAFLTLDDNYRGASATQPEFLHVREINRLDIWGTWFYDNRTQNCTGRASRAKGLVADDAAFRLSSSLFRNLDRGVLSHPLKSGSYGAYEVQNSSFVNCYTGIESSLPDPFNLVGNYFGVGRPPVCPEVTAVNEPFIGMQMQGYMLPQGITLTENEFQPGDSAEDEILIGTDCAGAGSMENYIRKNTYRDLHFANRASDGNFIAAGQVNAVDPNNEPAQVYGWLYKVSPDLDSLWAQRLIPPLAGSLGGYLGGVGILSSGNMVAGGYAPLGNEVFGWLVKFTPDGCVDTLLCNTVPVWEPMESGLQEPPARVYPNPTTGQFFVERPENSVPAVLTLYDLDGRIVLEKPLTTSDTVDGSGLPTGFYICRIVDDTGIRFVSKVLISRE